MFPIIINPPWLQDHLQGNINENEYIRNDPNPDVSEKNLDLVRQGVYRQNSVNSISYPTSAGALNKPRAAAIDYINADMAKHYKMGKASAYQEALANTSYQRAVADMKAAGLNPAVIFGAGRGAGASSSVYASSGRSGGSSGRGYYNQQSDKAFSTSEYSLLSTIGGLIGIALTGRPDGYWVGSQTTQGAMALIDVLQGKNQGKK